MRKIPVIFTLSLMFLCGITAWTSLRAQTASVYETAEVLSRIYGYMDELSQLSVRLPKANAAKVAGIERSLEALNFRWEAYMETEQLVIVQDEKLMDAMSKYKELYLVVSDAVTKRKVQLAALEDFKSADTYISEMKPVYEELYSKAFKLSLVKQTAAQLSKVKVDEQVIFEKVQQEYQKARNAASQEESLAARAAALDERMSELIMKSDKIQAMEFKPLVARVKDYLMSIAAVAMILMFISTVKSKLAAVKAQKEAVQKLNESIKNDEYPTI